MGQKQLHCGYFGVAKRRDPPQLMTIYFDEVVLYFDEGICKDCPKIFYKINTKQSFGKEKNRRNKAPTVLTLILML